MFTILDEKPGPNSCGQSAAKWSLLNWICCSWIWIDGITFLHMEMCSLKRKGQNYFALHKSTGNFSYFLTLITLLITFAVYTVVYMSLFSELYAAFCPYLSHIHHKFLHSNSVLNWSFGNCQGKWLATSPVAFKSEYCRNRQPCSNKDNMQCCVGFELHCWRFFVFLQSFISTCWYKKKQ